MRIKPAGTTSTIDPRLIEGLCWAKLESEINSIRDQISWLSADDHFVVIDSDSNRATKALAKGPRVGLVQHENKLLQAALLSKSNEPLKGLELFAGEQMPTFDISKPLF